MLSALVPVIRSWRLIVGLPFSVGVLTAVLILFVPPTYTASTTFVPAAGGTASSVPTGLAGLASQFGVNIGGTPSLSPDFFAEVLTSRELLRGTLLSQFDDPAPPASKRPLLDILAVRGTTQEERISEGIRRLERVVSQRVDRRTGIVTLAVKGRPATLAAAVANRMVDLLNQFNLERLRSQSRERRRFAEERKNEAERELAEAENQHLRFLQANRRYADSPLLSFEENRLGRRVQLRQEVFQTLTREYEEARIAEVRDTPLLTIIDPAVPPDRRSFPPRKLVVFLAMVASAMTALALVYLVEYRSAAQHADAPQYRRLVQAWTDAKTEIRTTLRIGKRP